MSSTSSIANRFWRPGTIAPGSNIEREETKERETLIQPVPSSYSHSSATVGGVASQRLLLPIAGHRRQILYALETHQVLIIVGETGSGKSSQLPQYLDDAGWCRGGLCIGLTQPRRVAASTLAHRVASERGVTLGEEVGYAFRFESVTSPRTRIKFMTDGLLLREMMQDPLLNKYSVIMLDEAHERSIATDVLMALLRKVLPRRPDLRLIISSATLDAERFLDYFQDTMPDSDEDDPRAIILSVEGRQYPVDIFYTSHPVKDYLRATIDTILHIATTQPPGDICAFLTGREEIDRACAMLGEEVTSATGVMASKLNLRILPLYAGLSAERQAEVFQHAPHSQRKVILSTNVAEASVTIDGIVYVIDSGFVKCRNYSSTSGRSTLTIQPTSQASAKQRAGRSGRTRRGICYRLYTEEMFQRMEQRSIPELLRTDISNVLIQLKSLGIDNLCQLDWLDPPSIGMLGKGLLFLHALGGLTPSGGITRIGRLMAEWPIEPTLTKMLIASAGWEEDQDEENENRLRKDVDVTKMLSPIVRCSAELLSIVAMLSVDGVFLQSNQHNVSAASKCRSEQLRSHFNVYEGDHLTLLNVMSGFRKVIKNNPSQWCHRNQLNFKALVRALEIRKQLKKLMLKHDIPIESSEGDSVAIRKAITAGCFRNAAQLHSDGTYRAIRPQQASSAGARHSTRSIDDADSAILHIHPTSVLYSTVQSVSKPEFVVFGELIETNKTYMRDITVIEPEWLTQLAPGWYEVRTGYEEENRRHQAIVDAAEAQQNANATGQDTDGVIGEPDRKHRRLF